LKWTVKQVIDAQFDAFPSIILDRVRNTKKNLKTGTGSSRPRRLLSRKYDDGDDDDDNGGDDEKTKSKPPFLQI
jgi:hypothetical protein